LLAARRGGVALGGGVIELSLPPSPQWEGENKPIIQECFKEVKRINERKHVLPQKDGWPSYPALALW